MNTYFSIEAPERAVHWREKIRQAARARWAQNVCPRVRVPKVSKQEFWVATRCTKPSHFLQWLNKEKRHAAA